MTAPLNRPLTWQRAVRIKERAARIRARDYLKSARYYLGINRPDDASKYTLAAAAQTAFADGLKTALICFKEKSDDKTKR